MREITQNRMLAFGALILEHITSNFVSSIRRPKKANDIGLISDKSSSIERFAIVMQGSIIRKDNFTFETLKLYKKLYPEVKLILSTWVGEDSKTVQKIQELEVDVLLNTKPVHYGISNVNLQIVSTVTGLQLAKKHMVDYCLKTRTDQRMYKPNVFSILRSFQKSFPLKSFKLQKERLIGVSLNTFKYRMYGISDMNLFGHINDMQLYWDVPLDDRRGTNSEKTLREYALNRYCEVYFVTNFMRKLELESLWTLSHSWQIISELFCVIDAHMLDLYWFKYNRYLENRYRRYEGRWCKEELEFSDWLDIFSNGEKMQQTPEYILDLPVDGEFNLK